MHYASAKCWCYPLAIEGGAIMTHNAKDLREVRERNGSRREGEDWARVLEAVPNLSLFDGP
jgi:hypothetical protein